GRHGEAELIETYVGATVKEDGQGDSPGSQVLTASGCDVRLGKGARLRHARVQWNGGATHHVGMTRVSVARDGFYDSMVLTAGGRLVRNDLHVALTAEGAEARLQGVYLTRDGDHVDNHTSIDHQVPRA